MICLASATISSSPHFSRLVGLFARVVSSSLAHRSMLSNPFLPESSQFDYPLYCITAIFLGFGTIHVTTPNDNPGPKGDDYKSV
jgi:hypothetical protein